jgi:outer membrane protein W
MSRTALRYFVTILIAILAAHGAGAADRDADDRKWQLRFAAVVLDPQGSATVSTAPGFASVGTSINAGGGASISLERRLSPLLGIEFGLTAAASNLDLQVGAGIGDVFTSIDMLAIAPLTVGANFHLVQDGPIDVYVGPMLALVRYSELSFRTGVDDHWPWWPWGESPKSATVAVWAKENSEVTWGARLGTGIAFGKNKRWSAQLALSYLDATLDIERISEPGTTSINLDPLMFSFGFGWRF